MTMTLARHGVTLAAHDDFAAWREAARGLIQAQIAPDRVEWLLPGMAAGDLFGAGPPPAPRAKQRRGS